MALQDGWWNTLAGLASLMSVILLKVAGLSCFFSSSSLLVVAWASWASVFTPSLWLSWAALVGENGIYEAANEVEVEGTYCLRFGFGLGPNVLAVEFAAPLIVFVFFFL